MHLHSLGHTDAMTQYLLHLSDIHFRYPQCTGHLDPERPYRTALVDDVWRRTEELGPIAAICITGDVAFQAHELEYAAAREWIDDLLDAAKCETVYSVPGNHDVARGTVASSIATRNAQHALASALDERREREFENQMRDGATAESLIRPLAAYNSFAAPFGCQVYLPEQLFWNQKLELGEGWTLQLNGLTSTFLSGQHGRDDVKGRLYLSPFQTVLDRLPGTVMGVLMHHPPDWFLDADAVEDALGNRAVLHLVGHKHRQRVQADPSFIRFAAGAVNPERDKPGWQPGYNIIGLGIDSSTSPATLCVEGHLRFWQEAPDMFVSKQLANGSNVLSHRIALHGHRPPRTPLVFHAGPAGGPCSSEDRLPDSATASMSQILEPEVPMNLDMRRLVLRFWELSSSARHAVAQKLDVLEPSDALLAEPERYGRALRRVAERRLVERLAEEIALQENNDA